VQELLTQRRQTLSRHTYDETLPGLTTLRILFPGLGRRRVSNRPQLRVYPAVQWCSAPDPGEFRRFDSVPAESTDSHEQFYVVIKLSDLLDNGPWTRRLRSSCTQACFSEGLGPTLDDEVGGELCRSAFGRVAHSIKF